MKKLVGLFSAAAITAAGVAPAVAANVELSGEIRVRHEITDNKDFTDAANDKNNITTQRTRLNAKVAIDDRTTGFISLQDSRTWGEEASTATTANEADNIDLSQGWIQIQDLLGPVDLKAGRQVLSYGDQRVIGGFEWSDNARRFDALKFSFNNDIVDADLFLAEIEENAGDKDDSLNGLYVTVKNTIPMNTLDLYYLMQSENTTGKDMNTIGFRLAGKAAGADWTAEFAKQGGDQTTAVDKDASLMAVTAGYTLADVLGGLRIGGEYFNVSGEDAAADDTDFENGFATNHFHYGILDTTNANVSGFALKLAATPVPGVKVKLEYWAMEEDEATGATKAELTEINFGVITDLTEKTKLYLYGAQGDPKNASAADDKATKLGVQIHAKF